MMEILLILVTLSNSQLKWENEVIQLSQTETEGLAGNNKQSGVLKNSVTSWTETHICPLLSLLLSSLLMFPPQSFPTKWCYDCQSWILLSYSPALEEFAGCMHMASLTIMLALPWQKVGSSKPSRDMGWENVTGKEEGRKRCKSSKRKRSPLLLLLASWMRWIFSISGLMTAFETLFFFFFLFIKNPSHWQTDILTFTISAACANTSKSNN